MGRSTACGGTIRIEPSTLSQTSTATSGSNIGNAADDDSRMTELSRLTRHDDPREIGSETEEQPGSISDVVAAPGAGCQATSTGVPEVFTTTRSTV